MDLLITVIGNAVMDPVFREKLLEDPVKAMDDWQFRLTKSEVGVLEQMFAKLGLNQKEELKGKFESLQTILYQYRDEATTLRGVVLACPTKKCSVSAFPLLRELRDDLRKVALEESKKVAA
jgi:hypothetical protein